MHEIAAKKGDFTLFALFKRADGLGRWDLVVSAPWLEGGKLKVLSELVDLVAKSMGRKRLTELARVETVPGDDPTVKSILDSLPVDDDDTERRIQNVDFFGLQIEEAIIVRAKRPERKKAVRKALQPAGAGASRRGN
jgi:hypothetical protein